MLPPWDTGQYASDPGLIMYDREIDYVQASADYPRL